MCVSDTWVMVFVVPRTSAQSIVSFQRSRKEEIRWNLVNKIIKTAKRAHADVRWYVWNGVKSSEQNKRIQIHSLNVVEVESFSITPHFCVPWIKFVHFLENSKMVAKLLSPFSFSIIWGSCCEVSSYHFKETWARSNVLYIDWFQIAYACENDRIVWLNIDVLRTWRWMCVFINIDAHLILSCDLFTSSTRMRKPQRLCEYNGKKSLDHLRNSVLLSN